MTATRPVSDLGLTPRGNAEALEAIAAMWTDDGDLSGYPEPLLCAAVWCSPSLAESRGLRC